MWDKDRLISLQQLHHSLTAWDTNVERQDNGNYVCNIVQSERLKYTRYYNCSRKLDCNLDCNLAGTAPGIIKLQFLFFKYLNKFELWLQLQLRIWQWKDVLIHIKMFICNHYAIRVVERNQWATIVQLKSLIAIRMQSVILFATTLQSDCNRCIFITITKQSLQSIAIILLSQCSGNEFAFRLKDLACIWRQRSTNEDEISLQSYRNRVLFAMQSTFKRSHAAVSWNNSHSAHHSLPFPL